MVKLILVKTTLYCACNIKSQQQRYSWITFDLDLKSSFITIMCITLKMNNITHVWSFPKDSILFAIDFTQNYIFQDYHEIQEMAFFSNHHSCAYML
jgi:hypothetical protein